MALKDDGEPDYTNDDDVEAMVFARFARGWAAMLKKYEIEERRTELLSGFLAGRYVLQLDEAGLTVLENLDADGAPSSWSV